MRAPQESVARCVKCVQGYRHIFCDNGTINDEAMALQFGRDDSEVER